MTRSWIEADLGDQTGRTALVTGANSGIGFATARALAAHGARVVLACRNLDRAGDAAARIAADDPARLPEVLHLDLADLSSVATAAERFRADHDRLDLLVNNAGIMAPPLRHTAQGFESQLGVNHLGHFALTGRLLPALRATPRSRVVTVSSLAHWAGRIDPDHLDALDDAEHYGPWRAYARSKLANLLFTLELDRRLRAAGATTAAVAAHPGGALTHIGAEDPGGLLNAAIQATRPVAEKLHVRGPDAGAWAVLRAATDPSVRGGDYLGPRGLGQAVGRPVRVSRSRRALDEVTAGRLWEVSETATGVRYDIGAGS